MNAILKENKETGRPSLNLETTENLVVVIRWPTGGMSIAIDSLRYIDIAQIHDIMEEWMRDEAFEAEAILRREEAEARA